MNVFIFALCVNILTLVNAVNDINFATILKILKPKQRQADYSNIQEINNPVEGVPIIPGFYLQKPRDISKSLFENPNSWPDDVFGSVNNEATRQSNTKTSANTRNKGTSDSYLNGKILKAVRNLNKFRDSQKNKKKTINFFKPHVNSKVRKDQDVNMLGRMFKGIKGNMHFRGNKINKKPQKRATEDSSDAKALGDLLKKFMNGNAKNKYRAKGKHAFRYYKTEEPSQEDGGFLVDILNTIQNNNQGLKTQETEIHHERPSIIIIATAPLRDELETENNAKESMEVSEEVHYGSNAPFLYQTRRSEVDIGGKKSSSVSSSDESEDSSYERNPGNPYTVHKNKYKQNWPYNHYMDGDHMNINPFGPQFGSMGPSGPELFFGRKWWYFNQDDFKPMG